ncbi:MAG TPA: DUF4097 family beta strand repeat-containing protein [Gemmatimonadaceae bacterium]|nr:DUF4097 family beta strand repeat-containing protein [Gemmatimonadaceae bacterium]
MRRSLIVLTAALGLFFTLGSSFHRTAHAQQRVNQRQAATADGLLRIHNLVGSVRVVGWDRDTIAVSGTIGSGAFYFAVGKGSGKMGVELPDGTAQARATGKTEGRDVTGSTLEVWVPRRTRVWVKTASASITVDDVTGGVDLYSVGGSIRVSGAPQDLHAESMDGAVELDVTTAAARIRSAGGAVTLRGAIENAVASSVSGSITVVGARLQRGRLETVTGDVRYEGAVERGSSLDFESHAGTITLVVPIDVSADFDVTAFNGDIRNGIHRVLPRLGNDLRSKSLSFTAGDGGAQVTIRNFKGGIELLGR